MVTADVPGFVSPTTSGVVDRPSTTRKVPEVGEMVVPAEGTTCHVTVRGGPDRPEASWTPRRTVADPPGATVRDPPGVVKATAGAAPWEKDGGADDGAEPQALPGDVAQVQ